MQILIILPFISFLSLLLGGFVLGKNIRNRSNIFFFLLCLGLALWITGLYWMQVSGSFYFPDKMTLVGGLMTVAFLYSFAAVFPSERKLIFSLKAPWKSNFYLRLVPAAIIFILIPFNTFISGIVFTNGSFTPTNTKLYPILALGELGYIIAAIKNFYSQFRNSVGYKRQKMMYFFSGLAAFIICSGLFDIILPSFGIASLKFLGPFTGLLFLGFSTAAIVSHSLLDIRILWRALSVNLLSGTILAVTILANHDTISRIYRLGGGTVVLVVFYAILFFFALQRTLIWLAQKIFFRQYNKSRDSFAQLDLALNNELNTKEIINISNQHLHAALHLSWIYFFDQRQKKIVFDPSYFKRPVVFTETQIFDPELNQFAIDQKLPQFFTAKQFEIFGKATHQPIGLLPIWDGKSFYGYFLLGPQKGINGLSAEQIKRTKSAWAHIQTAYARALLYQNLEQTVADQVQEITAANRMLKAETEKRMDFLRTASHQLRTPITAMASSLQLLAETEQGENRELAAIAYQKSKNLSGIVKSMLTLAKVEQSAAEDFENIVDLENLLRGVVGLLQSAAAAKNISLDLADALPENTQAVRVYGNQNYLEQAFCNLIENAIAYTEKGSVSVSYIFEPGYIIVSVKDTGKGVAAELKDQIFKQHIKGSRTGNGLGLYIVQAIIAAHPGAHVWFESVTDPTAAPGTTFYVRLVRKV